MKDLLFLAHDIRNIAAAISLDAERLSMSKVEAEKEFGLRTLSRIDRMVTICEDALKGKEPRRKTKLSNIGLKRVNLKNLLSSVVAELPHSAETVKVYLDCDARVTALLSEDKLYRLIYNLAANAVKAMESQSNSMLDITVKQSNGLLQIDVSDNGPGLPQAILKNINYLSYATQSSETTHGFGLMISKSLARELEGVLALINSTAKGTHFQITLPIKDDVIDAHYALPCQKTYNEINNLALSL